MPFEIAPSSGIFQKAKQQIMVGLKGVEVISDDFLVYSEGSDLKTTIKGAYEIFCRNKI